MKTTYLYKLNTHTNQFVRADIMWIDGRWFWSHHSTFTVMILEGPPEDYNEPEFDYRAANALANSQGWKLIGEIN